jgi:hypothetical protein
MSWYYTLFCEVYCYQLFLFFSGPGPAAIVRAEEVNFLLHVVGSHLIRARLGKFYISVCSIAFEGS